MSETLETESNGQAMLVEKKHGKLTISIFSLLLFGVGLFVGRYVVPAGELKEFDTLNFYTAEQGERQLIFPTFWEAWDVLHDNFINDLDDKSLFYGAVSGMVRGANDPYTVFSPPDETKQFEETIEGSFGGIGIEIGVKEGAITVISPLEGSPAHQAGVKEGDIIVAIDEKPLEPDITLDQVVRKIRGENGKSVKLTVFREGASGPEDITIVRGTIEIESVRLSIENDIALITITNFNSDTAKRFTNIAREAKQANVRGVIVDVRNNPGGFLQAAVDIASRFLEKGLVVVSEKGKISKEYKASGSATLQGLPVVLLVNGGSASASEILAGAIHDHLGSPIVGVKTYGKGSVQEFLKLSDGSSMRVTVAKWFTPSGRSIQELGIEPTVLVEQDLANETDEQLEKAKEEISKMIEK